MSEKPKGLGVILGLVGVLVLAGVGYFGLKATGFLDSGSADFSGAGHGPKVKIQVTSGDSQKISKVLKDQGVIASQTAFMDAARSNAGWKNVKACTYELNQGMKASLAVQALVDGPCLQGVTIQEGWRVSTIVDCDPKEKVQRCVPAQIARIGIKGSSITTDTLKAALRDPAALGLPAVANGDIEGYLFPSTYQVTPQETAAEFLSKMVAKAKEAFVASGIEAGSPTGNLTPRQVLVLASIVQAESGSVADMPKIARVFYNRLAQGMALQSDATVAYANNLSGTVWTTDAQRNNPSPYNTYVHQGLPPGPIDNPGTAAIDAVLHPAAGTWLFFVPVTLEPGAASTFTTTFAEHNAAVAQLQAWCARTHYAGCR